MRPINNHLIRWQVAPLHFELSCPAPLTARLLEVFAPWNARRATPSPTPSAALTMDISVNGRGWVFQGSQDDIARCANIAEVCRAAETDAALAILNRPDNFLTVHGALVSPPSPPGDSANPGNAILIVGPSHAGKSTLSCALWAAGWHLLSDDVTILEPPLPGSSASAPLRARPLPRRLSVRSTSRPILGESLWQQLLNSAACDLTAEGLICHAPRTAAMNQPTSAPGESILPLANPVTLRAICFLQRSGAPGLPPAATQALDPLDALMSLAPYTNLIRHTTLGECLDRLAPLLQGIPCFDLARGELSPMIKEVERLIDPQSATADR